MEKADSKIKEPDWSEAPLQRWLGTITKTGTRNNYRYAFRLYHQFTGMTATQLIDEAVEDSIRDPRQKKDIVLSKLIQFYNWVKTDYPVKSRGKSEHVPVKLGASDKLANLVTMAVRSFYGTYDIVVRLKGRHSLPKPNIVNKRLIIGSEQVKMLLDHTRSPRDRAIILTSFQGGLDASTLCNLKYGDVAEGLKNNEHPLKIDLQRPKTGVKFYTFLGKDSVEAIKAYLADIKMKGMVLWDKDPLFIKEGSAALKKEPLETNLAQNMLKSVAMKTGLVDEKMNGHDQNPLGVHALRESFGSIMINSGVPDTIVDFWLGHSVGEMANAYKSIQFESLKRMYLEREKLLSISQSPIDVEEIERKVDAKVDDKIQSLQKIITNYATENLELKGRITRVELEITEIKKIVSKMINKI